MKIAVIDNYRHAIPEKRRSGFDEALAGQDYSYVRYDQIPDKSRELNDCRGIILSGSEFDLARPDNSFDREIYAAMNPEFELLHAFSGPVLGICFGHQLMAIADEFEPGRTDFGDLRIAMMKEREQLCIRKVAVHSPALFLQPGLLWAQFNHKLEVVPGPALEKHFDLLAGSNECPVDIMQHKSRPWVGVQFHPEVGIESKTGILQKHCAATFDGHDLIRRFVRYCQR